MSLNASSNFFGAAMNELESKIGDLNEEIFELNCIVTLLQWLLIASVGLNIIVFMALLLWSFFK